MRAGNVWKGFWSQTALHFFRNAPRTNMAGSLTLSRFVRPSKVTAYGGLFPFLPFALTARAARAEQHATPTILPRIRPLIDLILRRYSSLFLQPNGDADDVEAGCCRIWLQSAGSLPYNGSGRFTCAERARLSVPGPADVTDHPAHFHAGSASQDRLETCEIFRPIGWYDSGQGRQARRHCFAG
jgi:hypothetical protein